MRCEIARDAVALDRLRPAWDALWRVSRRHPPTLHPAWIDAWLSSFGGEGAPHSFEGELLVISIRDGNDLACVAPFYLSPPRGGAFRARELRLLGDGVIGVPQAILSPSGEARMIDLVVEALAAEPAWDFLDLTFTGSPGTAGDGEALARRFSDLGQLVERDEVRGRPAADLVSPWERFLELRRPPAWIVAGLASARLEECAGPAG